MAKTAHPAPMKRKAYEQELRRLQLELCEVQDRVERAGLRVVVVVEGRDAAGRGGAIRAITGRVSPRVFRVVALPATRGRKKPQRYFQPYMPHLPAAGEVVVFDGSWYGRAGAAYVAGACDPEQYQRFLRGCLEVERFMIDSGILLLKVWIDEGKGEQERLEAPLRQGRLSARGLKAWTRWYDYARARDLMFAATDKPHAPWLVVRSDDKRRARLDCLRLLLGALPRQPAGRPRMRLLRLPERGTCDDRPSARESPLAPERY